MRCLFPVVGRLGVLLCLLVLLSCDGGDSGDNGGNGEVSRFQGTIEPRSSIRANFNGLLYSIQVYLPQAYVEHPQQHFPVLYILDAEWRFDLLVQMVDAQGHIIIVVGIGNGDGSVTGRRATDYRMPGARDYYAFLIMQVIPTIDARYRTDPAHRTLAGHSYGGGYSPAWPSCWSRLMRELSPITCL
jgi:enterochelin esterase-like enzyme